MAVAGVLGFMFRRGGFESAVELCRSEFQGPQTQTIGPLNAAYSETIENTKLYATLVCLLGQGTHHFMCL